MSVDLFWKRIPATHPAIGDPVAVGDLVPYWFDEEFASDREAGLIVGTESTGDLIGTLFQLRATTRADIAAAQAFTRNPPDWDEDWMVGTLPPDRVTRIAEFLARQSFDSVTADEVAAIAQETARLGFHRDHDDQWATEVLTDARAVAALFVAAAEAGQAMAFKVSA